MNYFLKLVARFILPMSLVPLGVVIAKDDSTTDRFTLASEAGAAKFVIEAGADPAVSRAFVDLRSDLERVSGARPELQDNLAASPTQSIVIAGVVGQSKLLDQLAAAGKLDLNQLRGAWESFVISVVSKPFPGVERALVIAGSDRRGAIYGIYEISAMIGVSPWNWWADVTPEKRNVVSIPAGTHRFGPPSVKYRGIFINDEDWGLVPWAAKTFDPGTGNLGPKTYAKVFELLLRLKANVLWPGMHPTTRAFNAEAENKRVADNYGIVMGSSHAEPMLRNNVGEWTAPKEDYNYLTNREGVLHYWDQRVAENGRYENIYTLGMRGIHDSTMQGPKTDVERIKVLEQVFADQRALIARHVRPEIEQVPQMFCAYKEVLDLYRQGLRVPDDVTLVWPDDNFGYVRNFATSEERKRPGGFGVYYHLSYLGRPLSYLWLSTTPPALVWEEMHKAFEHGADRMWIANGGDIKPAEMPIEFFLQMAWDINRWKSDNLPRFLPEIAARDFGPEHAEEIGRLLGEYYTLNFQRKPEHLQWWMPGQASQFSPLSDDEVRDRLDSFAGLKVRATALRKKMPESKRDAYYQLVYYPVVGAALANERFFLGERGDLAGANAADSALIAETKYFNEELARGKWRGLMTLEPADKDWASMRIAKWSPPAQSRAPISSPPVASFLAFAAAKFTQSVSGRSGSWTVIPGLGRSGQAVTVLPTIAQGQSSQSTDAIPRLDYQVVIPSAGEFELQVYLLPTHPITGTVLRFGLSLDGEAVRVVALEVDDGGRNWAQGVLDAARVVRTKIKIDQPGTHTLHIHGLDAGVVLDKFVIDLGGLTATYLGPVDNCDPSLAKLQP